MVTFEISNGILTTHEPGIPSDSFKIVNEIPGGTYCIWNIGRHIPNGYLPLCRPDPYAPNYPYSVDVDTLLAIPVENSRIIMNAVGYIGDDTYEGMQKFVNDKHPSKDAWLVERIQKALPIMATIPGIHNLKAN